MENDQQILSEQFAVAAKLHQDGELAKAQNLYLQILANHPDYIPAITALGILATQMRQYEVAVQRFKQALSLEPSANLHNNLANALKHLQAWDDAAYHYQAALDLHADYAEAHNNFGSLLLKQNKFADALAHFVKAVQLQPDYIDAHYNLGLLFLRQQKVPEALTQFTNVLNLYPTSIDARFYLASLLLQQGNVAEAIPHFQKIIAAQPKHVEAINNLGVAYLRNNQLVDAAYQFAQVLGQDEHHLSARSNLAATFLAQDRFTEALWHYQKILNLHPENLEANYNAGVAAMTLGFLNEAIRHFETVLKYQPNHIATLTNLAAVYWKKSDTKKAISYYETAATIEPHNPDIAYMLSALKQKEIPTSAPEGYIKNLFDNYATYFDKHILQTLDYQVPQLLRQAVDKLLAQPDAKLSILDLGCGTGLSGQAFRDLARHLIGIDLSEKMLAVARQKNIYDELIAIDIQAYLAKAKPEFDLILAADVFVYCGDLEAIFNHIYHALSAGGLFAFSVEEGDKLPFVLQVTARYAHAEDYLLTLAEKFGFSVKLNQKITTRLHNDQALQGRIFVLQKSLLE